MDRLRRGWKEAVMVYFNVLSKHLPGNADENHDTLSRKVGLSVQL
jgi:hypothetical protein